ncbi:MAG: zf-TFIIB domain-containing protein [Pseudomonadota bacterium]
MLCPIDGQPLVMTDRSGVEIDYCPKCRGVWLDRGELDKIIERAAPYAAPQSAAPPSGVAPFTMAQPQGQRYRDDDDDDDRYKKKRKGGLLGELFDF